MTLDPEVRRVLDGTPIAHVATILPDGAPTTRSNPSSSAAGSTSG